MNWIKRGLTNPRIFLSYRRNDAGGFAGQLRSALADHYGDRAVWLDHNSLNAGDDFAMALKEAVSSSDVLLAIIGPDWASATNDAGRRLDDPDDWVRREVATALATSRIAVIPVLVGEAELPKQHTLPDDLEALPSRQAVEVRPNRFDDDTANLINRIGGWRRRWNGFPLWAWGIAAVALASSIGAPLLVRPNQPPTVIPQTTEAVGGETVQIDILSWASDDSGEIPTLVVDPISEAGGGLQINEVGLVAYTSPAGFFGSDSFGFKLIDSAGLETTDIAFIEVEIGRLGGDFNVAVAQFSTSGEADDAAAGLSESIFGQIDEALQASASVRLEVAEPAAVGRVAGATPEARAEAAAELSDRLDLDVVVYGSVQVGDESSVIAAEFYLSDRGLTQAEELSGGYSLGSIELGTSDPLALSLAASAHLEPKITALSQLAIGLSYYQIDMYSEAERLFGDAVDSWPDSGDGTSGQEVVFHLLGNVVGQQGRIDEADAFYRQALDLNPEYARSHFGLAEVLFQKSKGSACAGDGEPDISGLNEALARFDDVANMVAPPLSFLDARARVETGRIYFCLSTNGVDLLDETQTSLESVLDDFGNEPRLRNLIAEAHQVLGAYNFSQGEYAAAVDRYRAAIDTTFAIHRKAAFYAALAEIYLCYLDQPDSAVESAVEYERLTGSALAGASCPNG